MKQKKTIKLLTVESQFNSMIKKAREDLLNLEQAVEDKMKQIESLEFAKENCLEE